MTKLIEIAQVNPRLAASLSDDEQVSFLGMADVSESGKTNHGEIRPYRAVKKGFTPFLNGDILVAKITPCFENGKIAQATTSLPQAFGSTEFHVVRVNEELANSRYVLHLLRTPRLRLDGERRMTGSAGQRRVPKAFLDTLEIPLPSLPEQCRVAAILDHADDLRTQRIQSVAFLTELIDSLFIATFGDENRWPTSPFGELLQMPLRNGISPSSKGVYDGTVLTLSAITRGEFDPDARKRAMFESALDPAKSIRAGELLICRGNGNRNLVGRAEIATESMPSIAFPDTMIAARPRPDLVNSLYLREVWHRTAVRKQIEALARTTNGTFKINQQALGSLRIPLAPLSKQQEFATQLGEVHKLHAKHLAHSAHLDEFFASLQHRAFRGEL